MAEKKKINMKPGTRIPASHILSALTHAVLGAREKGDNLDHVYISVRNRKYPLCDILIFNSTETLDENEAFIDNANRVLEKVVNPRTQKPYGLYLDNGPPLYVSPDDSNSWIENDIGTGERIDIEIKHGFKDGE